MPFLRNPKWARKLDRGSRPDKKRINELEKLRVELGIPHEALMLRVLSSPTTTRKIQKESLRLLRAIHPTMSAKTLLRQTLLSRLLAPPEYDVIDYDNIEGEIEGAMKGINSLDDLCDYIIALDAEDGPEFPDPFGIGKRIDEILAQEPV